MDDDTNRVINKLQEVLEWCKAEKIPAESHLLASMISLRVCEDAYKKAGNEKMLETISISAYEIAELVLKESAPK